MSSSLEQRVAKKSYTFWADRFRGMLEDSTVEVNKIHRCFETLKKSKDAVMTTHRAAMEDLQLQGGEQEEIDKEIDAMLLMESEFMELEDQVNKISSPANTYVLPENDERHRHDRYDQVSVSPYSGREWDARSESAYRHPVLSENLNELKLPKLQVRKFSGDIKDWLPFWSHFRKIHEQQRLDKAHKFEYLVQAMTPNTQAYKLVYSYPMTAQNYDRAVEALEQRYGQYELQVDVRIRELAGIILKQHKLSSPRNVAELYDRIRAETNALESLDVPMTYFALMLYPFVESCLPKELLLAWQRSRSSQRHTSKRSLESLVGKFTDLMEFLRLEVENEMRLEVAKDTMGLEDRQRRPVKYTPPSKPSAIMFMDNAACIFCKGSHAPTECRNYSDLSIKERRDRVMTGRLCYRCLKPGHQSNRCHAKIRCELCQARHTKYTCPKEGVSSNVAMIHVSTCKVFFQTLRVRATGKGRSIVVRVLLDSASHKSYVTERIAKELNLENMGEESFMHRLFGGTVTEVKRHHKFVLYLDNKGVTIKMNVLSQPTICSKLENVGDGPWIEELKSRGIVLSDVDQQVIDDIDVVIGADKIGEILTGSKIELNCGAYALETKLGWTLIGSVKEERSDNVSSILTSFMNDKAVTNLWELDVLGIQDPGEVVKKSEAALAAKKLFNETVHRDNDGRYEVTLPWLVGHPILPDNKRLAERRLDNIIAKLRRENMLQVYDQVFSEWLKEGIIERVQDDSVPKGQIHYLPHRPVIKEESVTTKVRPVFDASAKTKWSPSLNDCLEKGENLLEVIPTILLRFRFFQIGVIADIKKAFLQVSVRAEDRDVLRFLWVDNSGETVILRHRRVVFGVNCSPFLLGATIQHHLEQCRRKLDTSECGYSASTLNELGRCLYVDNCVTSYPSFQEVNEFKKEARKCMAEAQFDLRVWEQTGEKANGESEASVLGLSWDKIEDRLKLNHKCFQVTSTKITKRVILSTAQQLFDPLGFACPVTITPKLILQSLWKEKLSWDAEVGGDALKQFKIWWEQLHLLRDLNVPRWMGGSLEAKNTLHVFCDASQVAYAVVIFLMVENKNERSINFVMAKSRVSPVKRLTIPRLELMAAVIASRLCRSVREALGIGGEYFMWSDSMTTLAWIRRSEEWAPFVGNRVNEIRQLTCIERWRHVPGRLNPADLPSRGCTPKQLIESRWWEGPSWLLEDSCDWTLDREEYDEDDISNEKKRKVVCTATNMKVADELHLGYFSKYSKIINMICWILRFVNNSKNPRDKISGSITTKEIEKAEMILWKTVQRESFKGIDDERIKSLSPFLGDDGLLRLRSRICNREDHNDFRFPIVLPARHPVVEKMLHQQHISMCHVGTTGLLSAVRERCWIIGGRRSVRSVIKKCVVCQRFANQVTETPVVPLPRDRVRDAVPFEIVGVDFAGPLMLKSGNKCWVCLFTCAVYRAVHLELTSSLSTAAFIQVLRRFIARRGRPSKIYSDNGTNFRGAAKVLMNGEEWNKLHNFVTGKRICWVFNPPSAPWWGGFWERMVGLMKRLLRKTIGNASLSYEELSTILCDCEAVLNKRPITYVSDDPAEWRALTPNMFLRESVEDPVADCDVADRRFLGKRETYQQRIRDCLRHRFRAEYLGQLSWLKKKKAHSSRVLEVGDVVLIGDSDKKQVQWPLAQVEELLPGPDNITRLVRVRTNKGTYLRPVQKVFLLECGKDKAFSEHKVGETFEVVRTKFGRVSRKPEQFSA